MATTEEPLWPDGEVPGLATATPVFVPYLELYPVRSETPSGCVVICPGGGYGGRADHEGAPIARWLNRHGISAVVCHYRVAPYRHPYPSVDARRAVRMVRHRASEWGIDPDKVGVLGFSAGGHLAATVATLGEAGDPTAADPIDRQSARPDCAILCYAVISLQAWSHPGSAANLLGEPVPERLRDQLSHERNVSAKTPPSFLWHTADDPAVSVENSLRYALACRTCEVPVELHIFPHGRHGLGLADDTPQVAQWSNLCINWLLKQGFAGA